MDETPLLVSCGILQQGDKILALRRKDGNELGGKWEFPGGKIEQGETPERCLERELEEELGLRVTVGEALPPVQYTYPHRAIILYPYVCSSPSTIQIMKDHDDLIWDTPEQLRSLDWAEADRLVLETYIHRRSRHP